MREILLVIAREFNERVRTRSFFVGTLLFPVFIVAVLVLPTMAGDSPPRNLVVVNEAPAPIAQLFVLSLNQAYNPGLDSVLSRGERKAAVHYRVRVMPGPERAVKGELIARIEAEKLEGYIVLPRNLRETGEVYYRSTRLADPGVLRDIRNAATQAVQADRLARAGINVQAVTNLLQPVTVSTGRMDAGGRDQGTGEESFYFAYIVAMVIYFVIALYGSGVTRSVLEEKNNRIAELLVSTMRATRLMAGKILGVTAAVMLQLLIWAGVVVVLIRKSDWIAAQFSINPAALNAIAAQPTTTLVLGVYFVLGFLLFAACFAALGAAVTSDHEAQAFQMLLMLPLFVPLLFIIQLTTRPLDPLAHTLGLIPFTSPIAMPIRMGGAQVPSSELTISLLLLAATCVLTAWVAGKIYRIGILSTGRRPSIRELVYWIRAD